MKTMQKRVYYNNEDNDDDHKDDDGDYAKKSAPPSPSASLSGGSFRTAFSPNPCIAHQTLDTNTNAAKYK